LSKKAFFTQQDIMPAMKRPAAAPVANKKQKVTKVHQVVDPAVAKKEMILKVLQDSELPSGVKDMFKVMLPFALQTPRHQYQDDLLGMISSQLTSTEADLVTICGEKQQKVSSSADQRVGLEAEIVASTEVLDSASSDLSLAFDTKQQTELSLNEASSLFSERERVHDEVVARVGASAGTKLELELAISSKVELDLPEVPERQAKLASFKTQIESLVQDSNLNNAVLMSLGKEPDARGTFDTMVLQQLDSELMKLLETVTHDIETGDEEQVKSQESLAAGERALENARTVQQDATTAHKEALGCKKNADAALTAATKKLREFEKEVRQWTAELATANDSLTAFQSGPLAALEELSAEPVEEVAAVEAEAEVSEESAEPVEEVAAVEAEAEVSEESVGAVDDATSAAQAVEQNLTQDVIMAPADDAFPVASDKIVSTHAVNPEALSPQAGA